MFGWRNLLIGIAGCKVKRAHTTSFKSPNNIAWLKNFVMYSLEHVAELSLVDADIFLLILKNNLCILSLHLTKDDNIESLAEMCGVRDETKRKNLSNI